MREVDTAVRMRKVRALKRPRLRELGRDDLGNECHVTITQSNTGCSTTHLESKLLEGRGRGRRISARPRPAWSVW